MPSAFQQVPHKPGAMEAELVADLQQEPKHSEQVEWFVDTAQRVTQPSQCGQTYELGPYADVDPALLPVMRGMRKKNREGSPGSTRTSSSPSPSQGSYY
ncbi:hypothetical protein WJX84_005340 [Apatococcus fuscideae]|uniref:Uncharacterized protein n=1 Tax=Apatococcus fuscideae TaxID=2026836 RepID=A0AAW1T2C5_9CHLO